MEILGIGREKCPSLGLARATRDSLAEYVRLRWPNKNRRKLIEIEWGLTTDQARSVMEGTASASTIDAIWKHPNGGWAVMVPVMGAVIGTSFEQFVAAERHRHAQARADLEARDRRLVEMAAHLPAALGVAPGRAGGLADGRRRSRRSLGR